MAAIDIDVQISREWEMGHNSFLRLKSIFGEIQSAVAKYMVGTMA